MDHKDLKRWRKAHGWDKTEAAKRLGVPRTTYLRWEANQRRPSQLLPLACAYLDQQGIAA